MNLDPATADPRELAAVLRRDCQEVVGHKIGNPCACFGPRLQWYAPALLAVLDECDIRNVTYHNYKEAKLLHHIVRAAAVRFVAHDGTLPAPEGE